MITESMSYCTIDHFNGTHQRIYDYDWCRSRRLDICLLAKDRIVKLWSNLQQDSEIKYELLYAEGYLWRYEVKQLFLNSILTNKWTTIMEKTCSEWSEATIERLY